MKNVGVFAAMAAAVVFAYSAAAENTVVDWSSVSGDVSGGIYTVPADTTVNVGDADIAAVNALTKVIFANSNSVMRFITATPATVKFQGPGAAVFAVAPVLTRTWVLGRSMGEDDGGVFTRFVFENGISNSSLTATRYMQIAEAYRTNTIVVIDGVLATNITFENSNGNYWNGRFDFGENFVLNGDRRMYFGYGAGQFGVVRQRGGTISPPGGDSGYLGVGNGVAAYFLEGGTYRGSRGYFELKGDYVQLRQTGGEFVTDRFVPDGDSATSVRKDFVFGGNGKATFNGRSSMWGEMVFAFMDSVDFSTPYSSGHFAFNMYWATNSIWAYNGGVADFVFYTGYHPGTGDNVSSPTNTFHAFDGGVRAMSTTADALAFGHKPTIRVYERGAEIRSRGDVRNLLRGEFREPEGKVLRSIALSNEAKSRVWPAPPSVHIMDATGNHAAAVVDYDFDTGKITNITVLCKGENYTAPTANLRYRKGERLLEEDLVCEIGNEPPASSFVFSASKPCALLQPVAFTNYLTCTITVDMDMDGIADHGKTNRLGNALGFRYGAGGTGNKCVYFPNCTNIVLKSGELRSSYLYDNNTNYQWGFRHDNMLPNCWRIELYGGHLAGGTARFADIVLGGEVWLYSNQGASYYADLHTTHDEDSTTVGCLTIDAARGTNGTCTSVLKGGRVNFKKKTKAPTANSSVTVKNWKSIPASKSFTVLLDLSETTVNNMDNGCIPDIVYPEGSEGELVMKWETNPSDSTKPYKLLARRIANGTMIIFH